MKDKPNRRAEIAAAIRSARIKTGMTQIDLGVKLDYSEQTAQGIVARWETGTRPVPVDKLRLLADTLSLSVLDLLP